MAEEHVAGESEPKWLWRWLKLFTAFRVALDLKKLLLAAGGLVATFFGWAVLGWVFYSTAEMPTFGAHYSTWQEFRRDRDRWNLLHEMAGNAAVNYDAGDFAATKAEFEFLEELRTGGVKAQEKIAALAKNDADAADAAAALITYNRHLRHPNTKPFGKLRASPWTEDRGPNQYLLVSGMLRKDPEGRRVVPWERGQFLRWLLNEQVPYLVEPLAKFMAPIAYFFNSDAGGFRIRLYLVLVILWMLAVWGFFGGAICRIAAVQIARNEKISLGEAIGFARDKFLNLFTAPLFPLIFLGVITLFLIIFGLITGFTYWFGDIVLAGPLWPVVLVLGLIMAVVVVGLIGWPLMNPTISAEGSDNFDALSRSYSYVYQAFWHYLWYWAVALGYGVALVFFIGFMGSLVVYLGKWGLSQAPGLQSVSEERDRDPAYLFYYTPTSFQWRELLIRDNRQHVEPPGGLHPDSYEFSDEYVKHMTVPNKIGAILVGVWVGLFFLLIVGFGYSYFWTASTLIYFLMRRHVDDTELDEVYFEEGDLEPPSSPAPPAPSPAAKIGTTSLNVVESPAPAPASLPEPAPSAPTTPPGTPPSATP